MSTEDRIEELSQSVRRLRAAVVILACAIGGVFMIGAANTDVKDAQFKTITANEIELHDANGQRYFHVAADPGVSGLYLTDKGGVIGIQNRGSIQSIIMSQPGDGHDGSSRVQITVDENGKPNLSMQSKGKPVLDLPQP